MPYRKQGDKLRDIRERAGFTQQQVAAALNIDRSTYASYEIGRSQPNPASLVILAKLFNTPMEDLLDDELSMTYVQDIRRDKSVPGAEPYIGNSSRYLSNLSRSAHVYDLSKDEHALLCLYRAADKELRREMIDRMAELLHGQQKEPKG